MIEKRQFERYRCNLKVEFDFFEGNPDEIDTKTATPVRGKGIMLDISRGGAFIVTNSRVGINLPLNLKVAVKKQNRTIEGTIVRTGLLRNNPADIVKKYASMKIKEDAYVAVRFNELLEDAAGFR